jgi:amino acid adenylation domain-containing protein
MIFLDKEWETIAQESPENLSVEISPDDLAYVIYTSGSTGKPKGCLVTHHNVIRLMQATEPWFDFDESDVWTLFHSHAFDFSVWEIWGALLYGGRLVVVPYLTSRSPDLFHQLVCEQGVTVLNQTPSAFRQFIQADRAGNRKLVLRLVIFGGEALDLRSLRPWFNRHGDRFPRLINMYGITETTVHVTYRQLSWPDVLEERGSMIGRAIPDLRLYILDSELQPTPIDVPGEIFVAGAGVARGYLNRPELTKERFLPDPFSGQSGDRMYRSGDLAKRLANGDIEYMGRIDEQVKIRGFRVELGEIEATLRKHPLVQDAVVVLNKREGDMRLVAYIIPGSSVPQSEELRAFLAGTLPPHMLPAAFALLQEAPLTPHGKVDRQALSTRSTWNALPGIGCVTPRTPLERELGLIWQEILGVERVGVGDNFFHIGGHSLSAMQVMVRIRDGLDLDVPISCLFENPTLESLAIAVNGIQASMHSNEDLIRMLEEIDLVSNSNPEGI